MEMATRPDKPISISSKIRVDLLFIALKTVLKAKFNRLVSPKEAVFSKEVKSFPALAFKRNNA